MSVQPFYCNYQDKIDVFVILQAAALPQWSVLQALARRPLRSATTASVARYILCKIINNKFRMAISFSPTSPRLAPQLSGTSERPRLAVFRSNEHIYAQVRHHVGSMIPSLHACGGGSNISNTAQVIDDTNGHTLAAANTLVKDVKEAISQNGSNVVSSDGSIEQALMDLMPHL